MLGITVYPVTLTKEKIRQALPSASAVTDLIEKTIDSLCSEKGE